MTEAKGIGKSVSEGTLKWTEKVDVVILIQKIGKIYCEDETTWKK
jgi:hypothetical protein